MVSVYGLWSRQESVTLNSKPNPLTFNCDLELKSTGPVHRLIEVNILSKLNENPSRGKGDMKWTQN